MSEQKETKNMKNAAEAQALSRIQQNQQLSRMMMLSRLIQQNSRRMLLPSR